MQITGNDDELSGFDATLATQAINRVARITESLVRQGYTVSSSYRDPATNARVGGAYFSQHKIPTAVDFAVPPAGRPAFVEAARREGLRDVLNIHPEYGRPGHGPHMHLQVYRAGQAPRALFKSAIARPVGVQITEPP